MDKVLFRLADGRYIGMEKARQHKYIKRIPKPTGKGYYYFYNEQQLKDYREKGIVPGESVVEKVKSVLSGIMNFFKCKDEKEAKEKGAAEYEKHKDEFKGVGVDAFIDHLNEYLTNKAKWDARLNKKPSGEKKESGPKTGEAKSTGGGSVSVGAKKYNLSIMKKIAGIYGGLKAVNAMNDKNSKWKEEDKKFTDEEKKQVEARTERKPNTDTERLHEQMRNKVIKEYKEGKIGKDKEKEKGGEKGKDIVEGRSIGNHGTDYIFNIESGKESAISTLNKIIKGNYKDDDVIFQKGRFVTKDKKYYSGTPDNDGYSYWMEVQKEESKSEEDKKFTDEEKKQIEARTERKSNTDKEILDHAIKHAAELGGDAYYNDKSAVASQNKDVMDLLKRLNLNPAEGDGKDILEAYSDAWIKESKIDPKLNGKEKSIKELKKDRMNISDDANDEDNEDKKKYHYDRLAEFDQKNPGIKERILNKDKYNGENQDDMYDAKKHGDKKTGRAAVDEAWQSSKESKEGLKRILSTNGDARSVDVDPDSVKGTFKIWGHDLFVIERPESEQTTSRDSSKYVITEKTTGLRLKLGKTVKDAIEQTKALLAENGEDKFKNLIKNAVKVSYYHHDKDYLTNINKEKKAKEEAAAAQKKKDMEEQKEKEANKSPEEKNGEDIKRRLLAGMKEDEYTGSKYKSINNYVNNMMKNLIENERPASMHNAEKSGIDIKEKLFERRKTWIEYAEKLQDHIKNKDSGRLKDLLVTGNKDSRKIFEEITGINLGSSNKSMEEAINKFVEKHDEKAPENTGGKLEKAISGMYSTLNKAGGAEKATHKYYKRIPNPKGQGYIYFYSPEEVKAYIKTGEIPKQKGEKTNQPEKPAQGEGKKEAFKSTLKKIGNILAEALKGQDPTHRAGEAVEEVGENVGRAAKVKQQQKVNKPPQENK